MALSTAGTFLLYNSGTTETPVWTQLADILNYPDLKGAREKLDTTTLTNEISKTSIFGLEEEADFSFDAQYDKTKMDAINALTGIKEFMLAFGDVAGTDGGVTWSGEAQAYPSSGEVSGVRAMRIVTSTATEPQFI